MARYTIDFSTNASRIAEEIQKVNKALVETTRQGKENKIVLQLDTTKLRTSIDSTFKQLDSQIAAMQRKLSNLQIGGRKFQQQATAIGISQGIRERGGMQARAIQLGAQAEAFDIGSASRLTKQLEAARIEASQIAPNTEPWLNLQRQIGRLKADLLASDRLAENVQMRESLGAFAPGSLNALEAKLVILRNRAREISPGVEGWKKLNQEIVKTEQAIDKQTRRPITGQQRLGAAGGAFLYGGGLGGGVGSAVGGIAGGLAGGVPGAFTGAAIGQAVDGLTAYAGAIATTYAEVNKSRIALAGVVRDQQDYDRALAVSTEISKNFLLPIDQSTRQFTKLQASVAGAGFQTEDTQQVFKGIAAAIVATGGSTEDLNGALTATAQVFSKGKVTAEELRGQIGERLPGAFTIFAQSIGKTPQQLDDALQKGEVSLADFLKFTQELTKRYAKTAETLADAPENAGARLQVALTAASATYGGFFQAIGAGFQDYLTSLLNFTINNEKQFKTFIATVRVAGEDFYNIFAAVIGRVAPLFEKFFSFLFTNLSQGLNDIARFAQGILKLSAEIDRATSDFSDKLFGGKGKDIKNAFKNAIPVAGITSSLFDFGKDESKGKIVKDRETRIKEIVEELSKPVRPTQFGAGLGTGLPGDLTGGGGAGGGKGPKDKEPNVYLSDKSIQIKDELQKRLAAIQQNINLTEREKELESARLSFKADGLIAQAELDTRKLQIEKAGYANSQQALDDANAEYVSALNEARIKKEQAFTSPFVNAIESETQALSEAQLRLDAYNMGLEDNEDLIKAELFIREQLTGVEEKELPLLKAAIDSYRQLVATRVAVNKELAYQKKLNEDILKPLQNEIDLLRTVNAEEAKRLELKQRYPDLKQEDLNRIYDLEKVRDNIKQVRELIDSFVSETSSDYKGFLKQVISGEDAVESLKQFQEGLKDRVLTIFLDFAMAPVEKFFKESFANLALDKLFPKGAAEEAGKLNKPSTNPIEAQDTNTTATNENTKALENLTSALQSSATQNAPTSTALPGLSSPLLIPGAFGGLSSSLFMQGNAIGSGISYEGVVPATNTGMGSIASTDWAAASENIDTSLTSVVDSINKNADEAGESGKAGAKWQESLGKVTQGIGIAASSILGIYAGISQIKEGGTGNVLSGIGSVLLGIAGGIGGFASLFPAKAAAKGAVWNGGFSAFANGGMVKGPTLGLVGEGKYNEAIVPLPDGRSIPVQLNGGRSARDVMGNGPTGGSQGLAIDMKFETTKINGVEYVSREQLEAAMAETRKKAARDGATQGSQLALNKIKNSPSTRRQLGM